MSAAAQAAERLRRVLPGVWVGMLAATAAMGTRTAFALLSHADASRMAGRLLAQEAHVSLALGVVMLALERAVARRRMRAGVPGASQFSLGMALALGALFCTVAGYFALLPLMEAARAGQGRWSFGQLHAVSAGFFAAKALLVALLAWRVAGERAWPGVSPPPSS
ncbi:MAG: DUF4149 domain-containing protein [Rubrivivax sp.]